MRLVYFQSETGNVGDDLNPWLWERLFPHGLSAHSNTNFWGIGSILNPAFVDRFAGAEKQVVFGTGVRYTQPPLRLSGDWDVRFVRGPLSARALNLSPDKGIADGAYCLSLLPEGRPGAGGEGLGFMPYFRSVPLVDWGAFCARRGWTYISPLQSPKQVLTQLANCGSLLTEAMHGAILADVLRVPWARFRYFAPHNETEAVARFKWEDFARGMQVSSEGMTWPCELYGRRWRRNLPLLRTYRTARLEAHLRHRPPAPVYRLSTDAVLEHKLDRLAAAVADFRNDYL